MIRDNETVPVSRATPTRSSGLELKELASESWLVCRATEEENRERDVTWGSICAFELLLGKSIFFYFFRNP